MPRKPRKTRHKRKTQRHRHKSRRIYNKDASVRGGADADEMRDEDDDDDEMSQLLAEVKGESPVPPERKRSIYQTSHGETLNQGVIGSKFNDSEAPNVVGVGFVTQGISLPNIKDIPCNLTITIKKRASTFSTILARQNSPSILHGSLAKFDKKDYRPYLTISIVPVDGDMGRIDSIDMHSTDASGRDDVTRVYGLEELRGITSGEVGWRFSKKRRVQKKLIKATDQQLKRLMEERLGLISVPNWEFSTESILFNTGTKLLVENGGVLSLDDAHIPLKVGDIVKLNRASHHYRENPDMNSNQKFMIIRESEFYPGDFYVKPPRSATTVASEQKYLKNLKQMMCTETVTHEYPYDKYLLNMEVGDIIVVVGVADDGWNRGYKLGDNVEGMMYTRSFELNKTRPIAAPNNPVSEYKSWAELTPDEKIELSNAGFTEDNWKDGLYITNTDIRANLCPGAAENHTEKWDLWDLVFMALQGSTRAQDDAWDAPHLPPFDMTGMERTDMATLDIYISGCASPPTDDVTGVSSLTEFITEFPEWWSKNAGDMLGAARQELKEHEDIKEAQLLKNSNTMQVQKKEVERLDELADSLQQEINKLPVNSGDAIQDRKNRVTRRQLEKDKESVEHELDIIRKERIRLIELHGRQIFEMNKLIDAATRQVNAVSQALDLGANFMSGKRSRGAKTSGGRRKTRKLRHKKHRTRRSYMKT